jgi:putative phosphoesterase
MRAVVLADTHSRPLPGVVITALAEADVILHAGDVTDEAVLDALRAYAPTRVVLGNNDTGLALPETEEFDLDGVRVAMIHDSGARVGRERRVRKRFPNADVVVFGHSHIPWNDYGVEGQLLFNPASPTQRRLQPFATYGVLEFARGAITRHDIMPIA